MTAILQPDSGFMNREPSELDDLIVTQMETTPTNEAEWLSRGDDLLRELRDVRDERGANDAALKVELQRIKDRYAVLDLPLERRESAILTLLEQVYEALPKRGGKKSRALAYGTLKKVHQGPKLEVVDEGKVMEWIKSYADFDEPLTREVTKEVIDKKALNAHCLTTGVVPNGCEFIGEREAFYAVPSTESPVG